MDAHGRDWARTLVAPIEKKSKKKKSSTHFKSYVLMCFDIFSQFLHFESRIKVIFQIFQIMKGLCISQVAVKCGFLKGNYYHLLRVKKKSNMSFCVTILQRFVTFLHSHAKNFQNTL